jgi:hypothetical protein
MLFRVVITIINQNKTLKKENKIGQELFLLWTFDVPESIERNGCHVMGCSWRIENRWLDVPSSHQVTDIHISVPVRLQGFGSLQHCLS